MIDANLPNAVTYRRTFPIGLVVLQRLCGILYRQPCVGTDADRIEKVNENDPQPAIAWEAFVEAWS
jgi:hypothetical protein